MLNVSSRDLAVALAERLSAVAPPGFTVREQDAELAVLHDDLLLGISGAPTILETVEALREPRENIATAARAALSAVQDYIATSPRSRGREPEVASPTPTPGSRATCC